MSGIEKKNNNITIETSTSIFHTNNHRYYIIAVAPDQGRINTCAEFSDHIQQLIGQTVLEYVCD